jgi:hypothetical protein
METSWGGKRPGAGRKPGSKTRPANGQARRGQLPLVLVTRRSAARALSIPVRTINGAIEAGLLEVRHIGSRVLISSEALVKFGPSATELFVTSALIIWSKQRSPAGQAGPSPSHWSCDGWVSPSDPRPSEIYSRSHSPQIARKHSYAGTNRHEAGCRDSDHASSAPAYPESYRSTSVQARASARARSPQSSWPTRRPCQATHNRRAFMSSFRSN